MSIHVYFTKSLVYYTYIFIIHTYICIDNKAYNIDVLTASMNNFIDLNFYEFLITDYY